MRKKGQREEGVLETFQEEAGAGHSEKGRAGVHGTWFSHRGHGGW